MKNCNKCGVKLDEDADYCAECGEEYEEDVVITCPGINKKTKILCGTELHKFPVKNFCKKCGSRIDPKWFEKTNILECPACKAELEEDAAFCQGCGSEINSSENAQNRAGNEEPSSTSETPVEKGVYTTDRSDQNESLNNQRKEAGEQSVEQGLETVLTSVIHAKEQSNHVEVSEDNQRQGTGKQRQPRKEELSSTSETPVAKRVSTTDESDKTEPSKDSHQKKTGEQSQPRKEESNSTFETPFENRAYSTDGIYENKSTKDSQQKRTGKHSQAGKEESSSTPETPVAKRVCTTDESGQNEASNDSHQKKTGEQNGEQSLSSNGETVSTSVTHVNEKSNKVAVSEDSQQQGTGEQSQRRREEPCSMSETPVEKSVYSTDGEQNGEQSLSSNGKTVSTAVTQVNEKSNNVEVSEDNQQETGEQSQLGNEEPDSKSETPIEKKAYSTDGIDENEPTKNNQQKETGEQNREQSLLSNGGTVSTSEIHAKDESDNVELSEDNQRQETDKTALKNTGEQSQPRKDESISSSTSETPVEKRFNSTDRSDEPSNIKQQKKTDVWYMAPEDNRQADRTHEDEPQIGNVPLVKADAVHEPKDTETSPPVSGLKSNNQSREEELAQSTTQDNAADRGAGIQTGSTKTPGELKNRSKENTTGAGKKMVAEITDTEIIINSPPNTDASGNNTTGNKPQDKYVRQTVTDNLSPSKETESSLSRAPVQRRSSIKPEVPPKQKRVFVTEVEPADVRSRSLEENEIRIQFHALLSPTFDVDKDKDTVCLEINVNHGTDSKPVKLKAVINRHDAKEKSLKVEAVRIFNKTDIRNGISYHYCVFKHKEEKVIFEQYGSDAKQRHVFYFEIKNYKDWHQFDGYIYAYVEEPKTIVRTFVNFFHNQGKNCSADVANFTAAYIAPWFQPLSVPIDMGSPAQQDVTFMQMMVTRLERVYVNDLKAMQQQELVQTILETVLRRLAKSYKKRRDMSAQESASDAERRIVSAVAVLYLMEDGTKGVPEKYANDVAKALLVWQDRKQRYCNGFQSLKMHFEFNYDT